MLLVQVTSEHERKLDAPPGFRLPALGGRPLEPRSFTSVYFDVPGGGLAEAGITLRYRTEDGRGVWQLKLPSADARLELESPGDAGAPPEAFRRLLSIHLRRGPLRPVAELRTRRHGELVARNGTTAEVTVDEVDVVDVRRPAHGFVEVEIELRDGDPTGIEQIAEEVERAGAEPGAGAPKLFRVLGLDSSPGPRPSEPLEALRALLRVQRGEILAHDPGTRLGADPESLHDMRVAVRRSRALLRAGRKLLAREPAELGAELKELGAVLGAVRDLDVLLERLHAEAAQLDSPDAAAAERVLADLERERAGARRRLLQALDDPAYFELLDRFERELDSLEASGADVTLGSLAARELRRVRKAVLALPEEPPDEALHELRKLGKRARYSAELAGQDEVVRRAKKLQDVLGEHQDAVVAAGRLRELAAEALPAEALAVGRLLEREEARRVETRATWREAWERLDHAGRRLDP